MNHQIQFYGNKHPISGIIQNEFMSWRPNMGQDLHNLA